LRTPGKIVGLLLAAGAASRFGAEKLLRVLPDGTPLAVQSARHLRSEIARVLAVVRPGATGLAALLAAEGLEVVECPDAARGMGASIACAVRAAGAADAYLIALADMPFIRPTSIAAVRDALAAGAGLAAPYFASQRGHPVGISGWFRSQLAALDGDQGARSLLARHADLLVQVPVQDLGILRDVDRPGDLTRPVPR
jgi:molybdenum cofactor cytidylyltransferase